MNDEYSTLTMIVDAAWARRHSKTIVPAQSLTFLATSLSNGTRVRVAMVLGVDALGMVDAARSSRLWFLPRESGSLDPLRLVITNEHSSQQIELRLTRDKESNFVINAEVVSVRRLGQPKRQLEVSPSRYVRLSTS